MVDSIGAKPGVTNDLPVVPVARVQTASASQPDTTATRSEQPQTLAAQLASSGPPVDAERVQRIKAAVANGTFPISPATLADRLIALRYDWLSNDPA